jgi:hypothetical protein
MIHCRLASEKPSASWALGRAMFTIVASSTTINCARPTTARINQRRASDEDVVGVVAVVVGVIRFAPRG